MSEDVAPSRSLHQVLQGKFRNEYLIRHQRKAKAISFLSLCSYFNWILGICSYNLLTHSANPMAPTVRQNAALKIRRCFFQVNFHGKKNTSKREKNQVKDPRAIKRVCGRFGNGCLHDRAFPSSSLEKSPSSHDLNTCLSQRTSNLYLRNRAPKPCSSHAPHILFASISCAMFKNENEKANIHECHCLRNDRHRHRLRRTHTRQFPRSACATENLLETWAPFHQRGYIRGRASLGKRQVACLLDRKI
ncbi:hypothetical protein BDZ45DRAFT_210790 [Acephala macrosclerotiorum]|nr:hypothetical protein BDZ45DRAFT_210790 [Acephala macrosclerotiorum]